MEILRILLTKSKSSGKEFIVAGGHAVNIHGVSRFTGDLDLVILQEDSEYWAQIMIKLKYLPQQCGQAFCRYRPSELAAWPVDFMLVSAETFLKLKNDSVVGDFGEFHCPIVSIQHLIIMKIQALRNDFENRKDKDVSDIINLMKQSKLLLSDKIMVELLNKYGNEKISKEISNRLPKS